MVSEIWRYSKLLFILVSVFIILQLYVSIRFIMLAGYVDKGKPVPHPIAFEAFPFVVYNMYSGHIYDWGKYSYLKFEADDKPVHLMDMPVNQSQQLFNPAEKFFALRDNGFTEPELLSYIQYAFDSSALGNRIYWRAYNKAVVDDPKRWGEWLKRYISQITGQQAKQVRIYKCTYSYNANGQPVWEEQNLIYQYP